MNPVRVAVLGTGTVISRFHLPALLANSRAHLAAVCNLHRPSLEVLGREFGISQLTTDLDRIARDPQIDAVVIGLPNYLHAPVTVQMLEAGKHVLCEKPMAMSAGEARRMAEAARSAARTLMIGHVWRASPQVGWLRDLIDSGRLGRIVLLKGHSVARGGPARDGWFVRRQTAGGGALADVGIHAMDTVSYLFHDRVNALRVATRIDNRFAQLEVEDWASVHIEYENGAVAEIEAGWYDAAAVEPHGAVEVVGTEGAARTLPPRWKRQGEESWNDAPGLAGSRHPDDDRSIYNAQIEHFLDCILLDRLPPCDGWQGLRDMTLLEAAYKSARVGGPVETDDRLRGIDAPERPVCQVRAGAAQSETDT